MAELMDIVEAEDITLTTEQAITALEANRPNKGYAILNKSTDMAIKALEEIQQYRAIGTIEEFKALKEKSVHIVTGEWIDTQPQHNNGYYKNAHVCSNCNDYYTTEYDGMKFCPNCGAKMTET